MKRILSVMAVSVGIICLSFSASAQDSARRGGGMGGGRRTPEERAKMQTEQMVKAFSLSTEQTTKVDSINLKFAKEQQGSMRGGQGAGGDREAWMAAMKKTQDEKNVAFKTVLNEKQYAEYLKWVDEQRQKMQERMGQQPRKEGN